MQQYTQMKPSLTATRQASELGCEMAADDRSVSPDLDNAYRYADYGDFRDANRERWEHSEQFVRVWQERLFKLAEKEGNRLGMDLDDLMSSWDKWYSEIVMPMQSVLWDGWERSYELPLRFVQASHGGRPGLRQTKLDPTPYDGAETWANPTRELEGNQWWDGAGAASPAVI